MDDNSGKDRLPQEIIAICAMNTVLHTEGVAEMAPLPALSKEIEGTKGVKIAENRKGLAIDVYLNVRFGAKIPDTAWKIQENVKQRLEDLTSAKISQVNIDIMGVSGTPAAKGNVQER
ncbi:MAG: Asp23/Gls24 family envelope stress response protein [Firmicutes bacterium]|nr:Asp23/Gls24 family envelope stress response protein [Bacillota bacterium]